MIKQTLTILRPKTKLKTLHGNTARWPLMFSLWSFCTLGWPEKESQRPHVTQVHPENTTQLLQGQQLLLLFPPRALRLATALRWRMTVQAGCGTDWVGHGLLTKLPKKNKQEKDNEFLWIRISKVIFWRLIVLKGNESFFPWKKWDVVWDVVYL